jgi:hypothetical protein
MTAGAASAAEVLHFVVREEARDDIEPIDELTRAALVVTPSAGRPST